MSKESWKNTYKDDYDRFFKKVAKVPSGCWIWKAAKNPGGYAIFSKSSKLMLAVRWIYQRTKGDIPEGTELDHLCRNRACVNPDHVELVTRRVNLLRGIGFTAQKAAQTHCIHGHEFTPENTYWYGNHKRQRMCLTCNRIRQKKYKAERRTIS